MATLAGFDNRAEIVVDSSQIDSSLVDFPVYIPVGASVGLSSRDLTQLFDDLVTESNRFKIAVTSADGTTQLYVEIEWYDWTGEEMGLHVKIPSILSSVDTTLYIYWDATAADNTTYVGDTISVSEYSLSGGNVTVEDVDTGSAANLVDGSKGPGSFWEIASGTYPTWCKYDFGSGTEQVVNAFALSAGQDEPQRMPRSFVLQGSDNDLTWTNVVEQEASASEFNWAANEERVCYGSNSTAYRYYRVYMTAGNNSVLRMYEWRLYLVSTPTPTQNVWDSNFKSVHHNASLPYDGAWDSSGNATHGHDHRSDNAGDRITGPATGSRARDLDGDNTGQHLSAGTTETDNMANFTVEALLKADTYGQGSSGRIVLKAAQNSGWSMFANGAATNLGVLFWSTGGLGQWSGGSLSLNTWTHCAMTMDKSSVSNNPGIYVDGSSVSVTETSTPSGSFSSSTGALHMGARWSGGTTLDRNFDGPISEVRISDIERSAAWLKATKNTLMDTLLTIGAPEDVSIADGPPDTFFPDVDPHSTADMFMNVTKPSTINSAYFDNTFWSASTGTWNAGNQEWDSVLFFGFQAVVLTDLGSWVSAYRPKSIRINYTGTNATILLSNSSGGTIASVPSTTYVSGVELDTNFTAGIDIDKLEVVASGSFSIQSIEFRDSNAGDTWYEVMSDFERDTSFDIQNTTEMATAWDILNSTTADIAWDIINTFAINTAWDILNPTAQDFSWDTLNSFDQDIAWNILGVYTQQIAWDILNAFEQDTSWYIFPEKIPAIQQFVLKFIQKNFKPSRYVPQDLSFNLKPIQKSFTLMQPIQTNFKVFIVHDNVIYQ